MYLLLAETSALIVSLSSSNEPTGSRHTQVELSAPSKQKDSAYHEQSTRPRGAASMFISRHEDNMTVMKYILQYLEVELLLNLLNKKV